MKVIDNLTSDPLQQLTVVLDDGSSFFMELYFTPMQYGWFINTLTYNGMEINGMRVFNSPNMLHQFRNLLPFGIACSTENGREPSLQEDFLEKTSKLYILTSDETEEYSRFLSGEI